MKHLVKTYTILAVACLLLGACQNTSNFIVDGYIHGAKGKTLFFEQLALNGNTVLDSVALKEQGKFRFKHSGTNNPELYRLRLDKKQLVLAIDSTEHITIDCTLDSLQYAKVEGSDESNDITLLRRSLLSNTQDEHKQYASQMILSNPRSLVAYYALFQQRNGEFVFYLYSKADRPFFSAVATAWNAFLPDNPRSKAVYKLTLDVIQQERQEQNRLNMQQYIAQSENAFLDICLTDENGKLRYLSDLRGKPFVLEFSAVSMPQSSAYIFELRELYNAYHSRGLEIYSVSADQNRLLWEDTAQNLPWITVRGENGAQESAFMQYNVQAIPTLYLFNKQGEIVGRYSRFDQLKKAIEKELRIKNAMN